MQPRQPTMTSAQDCTWDRHLQRQARPARLALQALVCQPGHSSLVLHSKAGSLQPGQARPA